MHITPDNRLKKLIIIGDRVLIRPTRPNERTQTGLYLPPGVQEKEKVQQGYVIKIGPGYAIPMPPEEESWKGQEEQVKYVPLQAREGDLASYHFNPKLRELSHDGKTQTLSPKENELLKMLSEHMNDLLPREQALKRIWGSDTYFNGRSMDVYIAKLRKYLKDDPKIEIVNIHGNGFRLVVQE